MHFQPAPIAHLARKKACFTERTLSFGSVLIIMMTNFPFTYSIHTCSSSIKMFNYTGLSGKYDETKVYLTGGMAMQGLN